MRFYESYGSKNDGYVQVTALASHYVSNVSSWYLENDLVWSAAGGLVTSNKYGAITFRAYGHVSDTLAGHPCGTQTLWTNTATFTGCAYTIIDYVIGSTSIPTKSTTIVDGCPVYDPRLDSTVGGNGSHRLTDQTTWQFTSPTTNVTIGRNPALALLTYLIGWRIQNPVDKTWNLAWGMGVDATCLNLTNFMQYANICEEQVLTSDGVTTVQRYQHDGIYSTSDTYETVIAAITAVMGSCKLSDVGGQYRLIGGYDDTLGPIQALNDNDIVGGVGSPSPYTWTPAGPLSDTYNIVRGRFADPTNLYQLGDWGEIDTDPLADGIERTLTLDLGGCTRSATCQRIAKQWLLRAALTPGTFQATFGPRAFAVEVGSLVSLSINSLGWNNKLFRVSEQHETHDLIFSMTLSEEDPGVYAWDMEEKPLPASIIPAGYDPSLTVTPQGVGLSSVTYDAAA